MSAIQHIPHITINNILVYILPPSQLSQPFPTHLISTSLIQRHHFLNITPDNPVEYLCWPSPGRDRVIQLLETLATQKDDEERVYHVRYTSDVEYTYAHVRLDDELRLVFQWDRVEMWKYHDANLMPFPPGNHESPEDALADAAADALAGGSIDDELSRISSIEKSFKNNEVNENDDDAYWNGYGIQGESDRPHYQDAQLKKTVAADNGEDAYWAQYATVHGSGDSTVPSPLPNDRRKMFHPFHLQPSTPPTPDHDQNQQPLPIPIPRSKIHDRHTALEPPSPTALSERLKSITPRGTGSVSRPPSLGPGTPLELPYVPPSEDKTVDNVTANDAGHEFRHNNLASPDLLAGPVESNGIPLPHSATNVDDEVALKESIRSVYRLWKMSRQPEGGEDDRELFIRVARQVIELP